MNEEIEGESSLPEEGRQQSLAEFGPSIQRAEDAIGDVYEDIEPHLPLTLREKIDKYKKSVVAFIGFVLQAIIQGQNLIDSGLLPKQVENWVSIAVGLATVVFVRQARNVDPAPPVL